MKNQKYSSLEDILGFSEIDDHFCCPHFKVIYKSDYDKQFNGKLHSAISRD
uniref:Uncharacterized protein n=1 Tax=Magallana gigas TaxID=29159 RepID=K1RGV4_MAGGI